MVRLNDVTMAGFSNRERYRDLIDAADSIMELETSAKQVTDIPVIVCILHVACKI